MSAHEHIIYYTPVAAHGTDKATYTRHHINATIAHALSLLKHGEHVGQDKFPHAHKKAWVEAHAHAHPPLFEFPILHEGVYDGTEAPGPDRVLFGSVSKDYRSADYVAIIGANAGVGGRAAHVFPDTSVNLDPKSTHNFDTSGLKEGESHSPLLPPEVRDLISHADVKHGFKE